MTHIWMNGTVPVQLSEWQIEYVALSNEMRAVPLHELITSSGRARQGIERMWKYMKREDIGSPAMTVCTLGQVFFVLDAPLLLLRYVVSTLSLSETRQPTAWVDEVGQYLVHDLDRQRFQLAQLDVGR